MIELFSIYKFAFFLCPLVAFALTSFGTHLVGRNEGLQLLALSQAALIGNILGKLLNESSDLLSVLLSLLTFILLKACFLKLNNIKEQTYVVSYLLLVAITYLTITFFPSLDSHFAVGLFGDIVSISEDKSTILSLIFASLLGLFYFFNNYFIKSTFNKSVFKINTINIYEEVYFTIGVLLSLYELGFLFTLSFLILPTVIAGQSFKNIKSATITMGLVSAFSSMAGLSLSIIYSRVATVPAQILILALIMIVIRSYFYLFRRTS